MTTLAYGFWLFWTAFIIGNAAHQAHQDEAKQEMKQFKDDGKVHHRYQLRDIKDN